MTDGGITFHKQTVRDVPLSGKTVLVRVDYNVPLQPGGEIGDDFRIQMSLPTLEYLLAANCKVVIVSHLGRPKGEVNQKFSLRPVAQRLADLLSRDVKFVSDTIGERVSRTVITANQGEVILLENVRFYAEEKANDEDFARKLASDSQADYFVQDCFGGAHRAHASVEAVTHFLPSVAGLLLEREYLTLKTAVDQPQRPLVTIMGGAKVSDKIAIIKRFIEKADTILIGGAMANTFLHYRGESLGKSLYEPDQTVVLDEIYRLAAEKVGQAGVDDLLRLPTDVAVGDSLTETSDRRVVPVNAVTDDDRALDIGDQTIVSFEAVVSRAGTVVWNGPVGYSELAQFAHGSTALADAITSRPNIVSIVGGGDTADFVREWGKTSGQSFSHISTGGGAGLELMAGELLPGVEALLDARP